MDIRRARYVEAPLIRNVVIRPAEPEDVVTMLASLRKGLAEVCYDVPIPEPEMPYAMQAMLDAIANGLVHVAVNAKNEVVGLIALAVHSWPWVSPANPAGRYLTNEYLWVERAYRRGGTAQRLLEAAKGVADTARLPLMIEMSSGGAEAPMKDRFVRSCGFHYIGGKMYRAPRDSTPRLKF